MIVQCPACSARYRINAAKLPEGGGHIKCPKCGHAFFVQPEPEGNAPAPAATSVPPPASRPSGEQPRVARTLALSGIDFGAALAAAQKGEKPEGSERKRQDTSDDPALAEILRSQSEGDALDQLFQRSGGLETDGDADDWSASLPSEFSVASADTDDSEDDPLARLLQESGTRPAVSGSFPSAEPSGPAPLPSDKPLDDLDAIDTTSEIERLLAESDAVEPTEQEASGGPELPTATPAGGPGDPADVDAAGGKWRVKNAIGLHFDFPNLESLRTWLGNRDAHDGIQLTQDNGKTWGSVADFAALRDVRPRVINRPTREMTAIEGPPAAAVDTKKVTAAPSRMTGKRAAARSVPTSGKGPGRSSATSSRDKDFPVAAKSSTRRGILGLVVLILLVLGLVAAHLAGVIALPWIQAPAPAQTAAETEPRTPSPSPTAAAVAAAEEEAAERVPVEEDVSLETAATELIMRAQRRVEAEDVEGAIATLEQARAIAPNLAEIHCQLAPLYATLETGAPQAAEAQERCNALQADEPDTP